MWPECHEIELSRRLEHASAVFTVRLPPRFGLSGENSRTKVQNVSADSTAIREALVGRVDSETGRYLKPCFSSRMSTCERVEESTSSCDFLLEDTKETLFRDLSAFCAGYSVRLVRVTLCCVVGYNDWAIQDLNL